MTLREFIVALSDLRAQHVPAETPVKVLVADGPPGCLGRSDDSVRPGTSEDRRMMPETREPAAYLFYRYILLRVKPTAVELANARARMRESGVPEVIVNRTAELIGSLK